MGVNKQERDLEAGLSDAETPCGTPPCQSPKCATPLSIAEAEGMLNVRIFLPIITQREHFVAMAGEALSVGLGLGSAVGTWAVINEVLKQAVNVHFANWVGGIIIGFFLAPFLEKAARLVFGKTSTVLKKPRYTNSTRLLDHLISILSAFIGLGTLKGIQLQYPPFHASLGFEYLVFVVGFTFYSFVRTFLFTIALSHDYERESVVCTWRRFPIELFWEYLDQFHHVYVLITENVRDLLTFALYPYLMALWIAQWDIIDPTGKYLWVAHSVNIAFFFTFFHIIKELTYLIAIPFWSPNLPHHNHHSI